MTTGDRLRLEREKKGWTQLQAAEILGISNAALSNYERDVRQPDYDMLRRFASMFGTTTDYLLGHSNNRATKPNPFDSAFPEKGNTHMVPVFSLPITPKIPLEDHPRQGSLPLIADESTGFYFYIQMNASQKSLPLWFENETMLCLKQDSIDPGTLMLAWSEHNPAMIARFYEENQRIIAISPDPKVPPTIYSRKDLIIIGRVIAGIHFYD